MAETVTSLDTPLLRKLDGMRQRCVFTVVNSEVVNAFYAEKTRIVLQMMQDVLAKAILG